MSNQTPEDNPLANLIRDGFGLSNRIQEWSGSLGKTAADEAKIYAGHLRRLSDLLNRLNERAPEALSEARILFKLDDGATVEHALQTAEANLRDTISVVKNSDFLGRIEELVRGAHSDLPGISKNKMGRVGSWTGSLFNRHNTWLEGKSQAAKLGVAFGEIAVGSILMDMGGRYLSQAVSGLKETRFQQENTSDGKNRTSTNVLVMTPMPAAERVFKAVLGTGEVAAGIGGSILGFSSLFRA